MRNYITIAMKLKVLEDADQCPLNGESFWCIAQLFAVQPNPIRRWRAKCHEFLRFKKTKKVLTTSRERKSSIEHLESDLVQWFLVLHDACTSINYFSLCDCVNRHQE